MTKAIAFLVLLFIAPAAYAATYMVGDNRGWTTGVNYASWAAGKNFTVGDILVFNFDAFHEVTEVNLADYNDCDDDRPINSYRTSPANVTLTAADTRYFISPRGDQCEDQGLKLAVTVAAAPGATPAPSVPQSPPPSGTPGGPGTPATPSAPPPRASGMVRFVGGSRGWTTGVDYASWASSQNFIVGDILVFNFDASHEVMEVNLADYNDCDDDRPINSYRTSPANVTLTAVGTRYFISPRGDQCEDQGLKLAVTVGPAPGGTPAPSVPQSPPPSGTPGRPGTPATPSAPPPRAGGMVRFVGGSRGWTTGVDYASWASSQNFTVGDILVFNFDASHEVMEVNQADYNDCDDDRPINSYRTSPANVTLTAVGTRYFISPRGDQCEDQGLKLAVTVGAAAPGGAPAPSVPQSPPPSGTPGRPATPATPSAPPPRAGGMVIFVGGSRGWTTGVDYASWASSQNFTVGDILVFNFDASHEVMEVNQADYNDCDDDRPINSYRTSPANVTLTAVGTRYFISPRGDQCEDQGLKLAVTVGAAAPGGAQGPSTNGATQSTPSGTPGVVIPSGSASSILGGGSLMMLGLSLVLGLMG